MLRDTRSPPPLPAHRPAGRSPVILKPIHPAELSFYPGSANPQTCGYQRLCLQATEFWGHLLFRNIVSKLINALGKKWWDPAGGREWSWRWSSFGLSFLGSPLSLQRQQSGQWLACPAGGSLPWQWNSFPACLTRNSAFQNPEQVHTVWGVRRDDYFWFINLPNRTITKLKVVRYRRIIWASCILR